MTVIAPRELSKLLATGCLGMLMALPHAHADDPAATTKALRLLLSISNEPIPKASSCFGDYGQTGKARVRDLVATQLGYLYTGNNILTGNCKESTCSVSITHAAGEDVSSAEISFSITAGRASTASLQCVITP